MAIADGDNVVIAMGADGLPVAVQLAGPPADSDPVIMIQGADGKPIATPVSTTEDGDVGIVVEGADGLPVFIKFEGGCVCPNDWPEMKLTVYGTVTKTVTWMDKTWELPGDSGITFGGICPYDYNGNARAQSSGFNKNWVRHFWKGRDTSPVVDLLSLTRSRFTVRYASQTYYTCTNPPPTYYGNYYYYYCYNTTYKYNRPYDGSFAFFDLYNKARVRLKHGPEAIDLKDEFDFKASVGVPTTTTNTPIAHTVTRTDNTSLGVITDADAACIDPGTEWQRGAMNDQFFGSYEKDGVTYEWSKGSCWPGK